MVNCVYYLKKKLFEIKAKNGSSNGTEFNRQQGTNVCFIIHEVDEREKNRIVWCLTILRADTKTPPRFSFIKINFISKTKSIVSRSVSGINLETIATNFHHHCNR
jgi:hypothetical protein